MWRPLLAISLGSALGAVLRWQLGARLNAWLPAIPPGTLAANLIGGYIIGFAVAWFAQAPEISPEWKLFLITGFCGGLTTFSTFSVEVVHLLQAGLFSLALGAIGIHVAGSLLATLAGIASFALLVRPG